MTLLLAGDIGGTKSILRLLEQPETGIMYSLDQATYPSREFPDLGLMVKQFLGAAAEHLGYVPAPTKACFGIAGPVVNNTSLLTNLGWSLNVEDLQRELAIAKVALINDFVAIGYGILGLPPSDLHTLQAGNPNPSAPIAVIGAGTGLGEGFVIQQPHPLVFPTEGGHADFAPRSELEFQLLKYLRDKHDIQRVSVERVVSGIGIVSIYQFLRDRQIAPESPEIEQAIRIWEQEIGKSEKTVEPAAIIAHAAIEKRDRLCEQTLRMFVEAYGAEAGNLALKLLPYNGLYVAGGIAAKILPLLQTGSFLHALTQKGRISSVLEKIPVYVVLNPQVGLIGAGLCAAHL